MPRKRRERYVYVYQGHYQTNTRTHKHSSLSFPPSHQRSGRVKRTALCIPTKLHRKHHPHEALILLSVTRTGPMCARARTQHNTPFPPKAFRTHSFQMGANGPRHLPLRLDCPSPSTPNTILLYQVPTGHVTRLNVHFTLVNPSHDRGCSMHTGT